MTTTDPIQRASPVTEATATVRVTARLDDAGCPDAIAGFDAQLRLVFVNAAAAELAGRPAEALIGSSAEQVAAMGIFGAGFIECLGAVQQGGGAQRVQTRWSRGGEQRWLDLWIVPRATGDLACFARDITDMKQAEQSLRESIGRDSLTGLMNHAAFHDAVSRALEGGANAQDVALVLFDLDYLKLINDVHGHQTGDAALRAVADVLRATTRESDRVARLGGDEFAALFVGVGRDIVLRIAQRAVTQVCATQLPGVGRLSMSAGIAFVASTREPGDLFDRADAAVYDAKARGRGVASVADLTEIAYASRRRDLDESTPLLPSPELADARDVITAARGALRTWVQVLACSGGCVDLLDAKQRSVKAVAYYRFGHDDWKLAEQTYELTDYPNTAQALAQGQTYSCRVDDPLVDSAEAALLRERGFASLLLTPLVSAGRSIGIIELFDTRPREFTTADKRVALALAHHLAPLLALLQARSDPAAPSEPVTVVFT